MQTLEQPTPRRFLKTSAAAEYIGIHPRTLRGHAEKGLIACSRPGARTMLFDVRDLVAFVKAHQSN